ncbi:MAG: signal peptide peptidase SppA [Acidimicrobiaceae bacterium]|nr:signal peptide peptidase SppA [Acidimicrobiaceae bacterium]
MDPVRGLAELRRRRNAPYLLEVDLTEPLLQERPTDPLARFQTRRRTPLPVLLQALRDAATDRKVCGLLAKVGSLHMGLAQAQEVRQAIAGFRAGGKPAVAWSETFGELAAATVSYYLAAGFDEIWLQPSGSVGLVGVAAGSLFLAEALDEAGVQRQIGTRHEYKSAASMFLDRSFTEPDREARGRVLASALEQVVAGVGEGRGIDEDGVRSLVDRAPLTAKEADEAGLVDRLGYRDEVYTDVRRRTSTEAQLLFAGRYRRRPSVPEQLGRALKRRRGVVAVITGNGMIRLGRGARGPGSSVMGSDTIGAALRAAGREEQVRAVVFRVNSPGGSYMASDAIWREVTRLRESGKPVIVSMGDVAASGGYFVAAPADTIVAEPGTLTGSIGVLGGKLSVAQLLERFGVHYDEITEGRHARMMSPFDEFSAEEWQRVSSWLDEVYDDFVQKVAAGRSMTTEAVHEVARGRVWTGADAHERGLVDELGGLEHAVTLARERAKLPPDAEVVPFPRTPPMARLRAPRSSEDAGAVEARFDLTGPLATLAGRLGLPSAGALVMPPFEGWPIH